MNGRYLNFFFSFVLGNVHFGVGNTHTRNQCGYWTTSFTFAWHCASCFEWWRWLLYWRWFWTNFTSTFITITRRDGSIRFTWTSLYSVCWVIVSSEMIEKEQLEVHFFFVRQYSLKERKKLRTLLFVKLIRTRMLLGCSRSGEQKAKRVRERKENSSSLEKSVSYNLENFFYWLMNDWFRRLEKEKEGRKNDHLKGFGKSVIFQKEKR